MYTTNGKQRHAVRTKKKAFERKRAQSAKYLVHCERFFCCAHLQGSFASSDE